MSLEIRHDVMMFELTTLSAVIHKAQVVKRNKLECKKQTTSPRPQFLGKRPSYTSPSTKSFNQSSGPKRKKPMCAKKTPSVPLLKDAPKSDEVEPKVECKVYFGPHDILACKWMPGACFSCGKLGHKSFECRNLVLKPIFCYLCK